jgi:hypothetical protein
VPHSKAALITALKHIWNNGRPIRFPKRNVYGGNGAGKKIANVLSSVRINAETLRKLIVY